MFVFICWMLFSFQVTPAPLPFIEKMKHDPAALLDLLHKADNATIREIIVILEELINDNLEKRKQLNQTLVDAQAGLTSAEALEAEQTGKCATLETELNDKTQERAVAQGAFNEAEATQLERENPLRKELEILRAVLGNVTSLQNNSDQKSRRLLSFATITDLVTSMKEDPHALLDNLVDADPEKLQLVINLLEELIEAAEKELNDVMQDVADADEVLKAAISAVWDATTASGICEKQLDEKTGDVAEFKGIVETAQKQFDTMGHKLVRENEILKEIIDDLEALMNGE